MLSNHYPAPVSYLSKVHVLLNEVSHDAVLEHMRMLFG
jgi:hypothetical protein